VPDLEVVFFSCFSCGKLQQMAIFEYLAGSGGLVSAGKLAFSFSFVE
ncbi:hypothetical protein A2U01_0027359, partial [Trifolium medium]|nr:hypothetical protein [Trifolium medium]